ncbi:MAG: cell wall-binding repeat-containing protein [Actinobacteria bacterium]|uniref:Cell wall binding repeat protein n=1 Tax=Nostocoides veronense TaxID=330836 RepID=A0ABP4YBU9_9MICO|nr:cell wall-binding repeat-containing protein [Actinomycetota bacterium]
MKTTTTRRTALAAAVVAGALGIAPALTMPATAKAGTVMRISGADRYEASANISKASFAPGVDVAYVASGLVFTDALSGAPVAGMKGGPVLLTKTDTLPQPIIDELTRLQPKQIVVFGGTNSVMGSVMNELRKLTTGEVTRVAGQTRYSTSAKISSLNYAAGPETTYVASGEVFPDALSGAPVAGKTPGPLLLIESDGVPGIVKKELERLQSKRIVVLGGENTITPETYAFLTRYTTGAVARWAGDDRFSTSATISSNSFAPGVGTVYVASGRVFADALSAAPVGGRDGNPVLLVDTNSIPSSVDAELKRLKPNKIVIVGGPASVSSTVEAQLASYVS